MKIGLKLQLFAGKSSSSTSSNSTTNSSSKTKTASQTVQNQSSSTVGGSESHTTGSSESNSHTSSVSASRGGSESNSTGRTWASGEVEANTQAMRNQYNKNYQEGDKVGQTYDRLQSTLENKPGFQSKYEGKLDELYNSILNRDKFSYDFNADGMYQMYKDQYQQQGKAAMQDTMGQASAMTGGYGSSYAQSVGQQTYQDYLTQLNSMIPTLRNQAYQEYQQEGQDLLNKYNVTNDAYNREYTQYRNDVSDWQADRSFNYGMYSDERQFDYNQFSNDRNYWNQEYWNERNSATSNSQNTVGTNWNNTTSESDTVSKSNYTQDTSTNSWSNTDSTSTSNTRGYSNTDSTSSTRSNSTTNYTDASSSGKTGTGKNGNGTTAANGNSVSSDLVPYDISRSDYLGNASSTTRAEMVDAVSDAYKKGNLGSTSKELYEQFGLTRAEQAYLQDKAGIPHEKQVYYGTDNGANNGVGNTGNSRDTYMQYANNVEPQEVNYDHAGEINPETGLYNLYPNTAAYRDKNAYLKQLNAAILK